MRTFLLSSFLLLSLLFSQLGFAQDTIVTWKATATATAAGSYEVQLEAVIKKGFHLYAKDDADGLGGLTVAATTEQVSAGPFSQAPTYEDYKDPIFENNKQIVKEGFMVKFPLTITGTVPEEVVLKLSYEVADVSTFLPEEQEVVLKLAGGVAVKQSRILIPSINLDAPLSDCSVGGATVTAGNTESKGLLTLFALGFLGGLVALLTPCVFPMIPLTVSFFTKKAVNRKAGIRNAFIYGFFIFFIYVVLSLPFHFLDSLNPEILNNISTNVYLNVFFFIIFIVFALSFFGFYEITLPGSMSSGADSKAGAGNIVGIFFMALTLALVSFSCTGPILGSLLAGSLSADGGAMQLTSG
ncbi:MAG: hypothetical protein EOO03_16440, partial [Chitinophagaceae bacterium]